MVGLLYCGVEGKRNESDLYHKTKGGSLSFCRLRIVSASLRICVSILGGGVRSLRG
jgi:hypothetical protein